MKQRTYNFIITLLVIATTATSCKKFLDVERSNQEKFIETADDCQKILDNYGDFITAGMNNAYPSDGEASADNYYFGENRYNQLSDENKKITTWHPEAQRSAALVQWQNPYKIVYYANLVLDNLVKIKEPDQQKMNSIKGSALFFRAFTFWNLAQLYAGAYVQGAANNSPGIPLRLTSDLNDKTERGTVQQTYDRIVEDLKSAVELLPVTSSISTRPNKVAAYAMLARVYLSMEDYQNALSSASSALQLNNNLLDYSTLSTSSETPFIRFNNKEIIFHAVMGTEPNLFANLLFPGISTFLPGAFVSSDLYNSYGNNDLRKQVFYKLNGSQYPDTYRFTGNYDQESSAALFTGLAVDEVFLTRAECYARSGDQDAAMSDLNTLLRSRWAKDGNGNSTYVNASAATPEQALFKILEERRKELVFRGLRWTDLRRLNRDNRFKINIERKLVSGLPPNQVVTVIGSLPAGDPRYVLLIPNEVMAISGIAQNPR